MIFRRIGTLGSLVFNKSDNAPRLSLYDAFIYFLRKRLPEVKGRLDYPNKHIFLTLQSAAELMRLTSCSKEPETVEWLEHFLKDGDVFYDIGANIGAYSLIAASIKNNVQVVSFEPGYNSFASLNSNIFLNNLGENILPISISLGRENGISNFLYSELDAGAASHVFGPSNEIIKNSARKSIQIPVLSLDSLKETISLPTPSLIKIDVDGAELDVITGASSVLSEPGLRSILIEIDYRDPNAHSVEKIILSKGFLLNKKYPRQKGESTYLYNCIFTRK